MEFSEFNPQDPRQASDPTWQAMALRSDITIWARHFDKSLDRLLIVARVIAFMVGLIVLRVWWIW